MTVICKKSGAKRVGYHLLGYDVDLMRRSVLLSGECTTRKATKEELERYKKVK